LTRLFFVRHGQSAANAGGLTMEHATIPLTPLGVAQSDALADSLAEHLQVEPSRVLTSEFTRARDTARRFCDKTGRQAETHPLLHEFETIDPALLEGMTGQQRRPITEAYWERAAPHERMGPRAETFAEFEGRVAAFMDELPSLPDRSVMFGHGMWMGLMFWKLLGFSANDSQGMKAFRRFHLGLPLPNCVVYALESTGTGRWHWQVDEKTLRQVASLRLETAQNP
jgi:alpha-ribazole phosphatase